MVMGSDIAEGISTLAKNYQSKWFRRLSPDEQKVEIIRDVETISTHAGLRSDLRHLFFSEFGIPEEEGTKPVPIQERSPMRVSAPPERERGKSPEERLDDALIDYLKGVKTGTQLLDRLLEIPQNAQLRAVLGGVTEATRHAERMYDRFSDFFRRFEEERTMLSPSALEDSCKIFIVNAEIPVGYQTALRLIVRADAIKRAEELLKQPPSAPAEAHPAGAPQAPRMVYNPITGRQVPQGDFRPLSAEEIKASTRTQQAPGGAQAGAGQGGSRPSRWEAFLTGSGSAGATPKAPEVSSTASRLFDRVLGRRPSAPPAPPTAETPVPVPKRGEVPTHPVPKNAPPRETVPSRPPVRIIPEARKLTETVAGFTAGDVVTYKMDGVDVPAQKILGFIDRTKFFLLNTAIIYPYTVVVSFP